MKHLQFIALSIVGVMLTSPAFAVRHEYATTQMEAEQLIWRGYWAETSPGYIWAWGQESWAQKHLYRMYSSTRRATKLVVGTDEFNAATKSGWVKDAELGNVPLATNWVCDLDPSLPVLYASLHSTFKDWFYTTDEYEDYYVTTYLGYSSLVASACLLPNPDPSRGTILLRRFYKQDGY